jgi:hypothetical protein
MEESKDCCLALHLRGCGRNAFGKTTASAEDLSNSEELNRVKISTINRIPNP